MVCSRLPARARHASLRSPLHLSLHLSLAFLLGLALAAPKPSAAQTLSAPAAEPPAAAAQPVTEAAVLSHHAQLVHASYSDALAAAQAMQRDIAAFIAAPAEGTLAQARKSWLAAREWYGQTEAFRFYGGPIDDDQGPEGRLNSWPLDESYIDGVKGKPGAGYINDRSIAISAASLSAMNERGGEENIAAGWHAIEFLLWGQDFDTAGPGKRPHTDFVDGGAPNADRRRQALAVTTELLITDLQYLVAAWAPDAPTNYRAAFERGGQESMRRIIVGLGSLSRGELAGERMEVALSTRDQEDEHSCFSDNTHRDIVANALGIENVWLGRYVRADGRVLQGPSPRDLVAARDAALAERTTAQMAKSVAAAKAIAPPFDQAISSASGRAQIQATIDSLVQQSKDLVASASALGITRLTLVRKQ